MHRSSFRGVGRKTPANGPVEHLSKSISSSIAEPYHNLSQIIKQIERELTKIGLLIANVRNDINSVKSGSAESDKAVSAAHLSVMRIEQKLSASVEKLSSAISAIKIPSNKGLESKVALLEKTISKAQQAMDKAKKRSDVSTGGNETIAKAMSSIMEKIDNISDKSNGGDGVSAAIEARLESIASLLQRPREVIRGKGGVISGWRLN